MSVEAAAVRGAVRSVVRARAALCGVSVEAAAVRGAVRSVVRVRVAPGGVSVEAAAVRGAVRSVVRACVAPGGVSVEAACGEAGEVTRTIAWALDRSGGRVATDVGGSGRWARA